MDDPSLKMTIIRQIMRGKGFWRDVSFRVVKTSSPHRPPGRCTSRPRRVASTIRGRSANLGKGPLSDQTRQYAENLLGGVGKPRQVGPGISDLDRVLAGD